MTENVKLNFFKKLIMSVKDLDKYDQLAVQTVRQGISYFLKLILLFAVVLSVMYSMQIYKLINIAKEKIDTIPEFEYKNGEILFKGKGPVILENMSKVLNSVLILPEIDKETEEKYTSKVKTYNSYLILNKSNFAISVNDNKLQYNYKDVLEKYSIKSFDKGELSNFIKSIDATSLSIAFFLVMIIYLFFWYAIFIGADILITFLVSFVTSRIARIKLRTSALVNISIHSLTLSILLYLLYYVINMLTGFEISNFRLMYVLVASIYASISVLIIKADFIERQKELAEVIKEQQKIRAEFNNDDDINDEEDSMDENNKNDAEKLKNDNEGISDSIDDASNVSEE